MAFQSIQRWYKMEDSRPPEWFLVCLTFGRSVSKLRPHGTFVGVLLYDPSDLNVQNDFGLLSAVVR